MTGPMKLIIQIPCLNEAENIKSTLQSIPAAMAGIDRMEILVIDDGSSDNTSALARACGAHHIIRFNKNRGLASAFRAGIAAALDNGADIIVNMDGDNQYPGQAIPALIAPLLAGEADIVIGNRNPEQDSRIPPLKRLLYKTGRILMNRLCGSDIPDPVSGFRALSRQAAMDITIASYFSYTLEMIIQAEHKYLKIAHVPITANAVIRPSRLFRSMPMFIYYSARTIIESYLLYKPLKFFTVIASAFAIVGLVPIIRFTLAYLEQGHAGHIQSLILGSSFILIAVALLVAGLLSHLTAHNRVLLETLLNQVRGNRHGN
jgi:glycosyltransferase involved in cell wall biosynthesis